MNPNALFVKNMVCNRCIMVVEKELKDIGASVLSIKLGEVQLAQELDETQKQALVKSLNALGFELIDDKRNRIVERIKNIIVEIVHHQSENTLTKLSEVLGSALLLDYNYLSNIFSESEGITIEKYFIAQRIEKVKELLAYGELSLSEIAYQLNYSSVAYLSNQFKKVTGITPSQFKHAHSISRTPLDQV